MRNQEGGEKAREAGRKQEFFERKKGRGGKNISKGVDRERSQAMGNETKCNRRPEGDHTDKKLNQIFLIYKEIPKGSVASHLWLMASSYMVKYWRIFSNIRKPFLIYDFATDPIWIVVYVRKISFFFYQCRKWSGEGTYKGGREDDKGVRNSWPRGCQKLA